MSSPTHDDAIRRAGRILDNELDALRKVASMDPVDPVRLATWLNANLRLHRDPLEGRLLNAARLLRDSLQQDGQAPQPIGCDWLEDVRAGWEHSWERDVQQGHEEANHRMITRMLQMCPHWSNALVAEISGLMLSQIAAIRNTLKAQGAQEAV